MAGESDTEISNQEDDIPREVKAIIDNEVANDIAPLLEEGDKETAEFLQGVMQDLRQGTYSFLSWLNKTENPKNVLYPASGLDTIPKLAFGEDKVVHTSLEGKRGNDQSYYERLGTGMKVIADNQTLPFKDESFQVICLLDSQEAIIGTDPNNYLKLLTNNGLVVLCKNNTLNPEDSHIDTYSQIPSLKPVPVPKRFQMQGEAQTEFALFRKIS